MGDAHHCSGSPVSEMTYTVSSGTLNPSIPYHTYLKSIDGGVGMGGIGNSKSRSCMPVM